MVNWLFSPQGEEFLAEQYGQMARSTYDIAQELGTYPNLVRRALKKHGIHLRNRSDAQKNAISTKRHPHPTRGKPRRGETKEKISASMAGKWEVVPETERKRRQELSRSRWEAMPEHKRDEITRKAAGAVRKAAEDGSKLEQFLYSGLREAGYDAVFHANFVISAEEMHVDILLPTMRVAIEIDGPSHHQPIWGEERLAKRVEADNRKTGLLIQAGYSVLRIKNVLKHPSGHRFKLALTSLLLRLAEGVDKLSEIEV